MEGVRLSQLAKCPRMAAYGALNTLEDDMAWDPQEAYFRGKVYEAVAALRAAEEWGSEHDGAPNIERQVVIPWELGEGHADVYVRSIRKLIEVKSSTSESDIPLVDGIFQAGLYFARHPEAESCDVWFFDPRKGSFRPLVIPVERPDEALIQQKIDAVRTALDGGPLPGRVCSEPKRGPEHLCSFVGTCFADWVDKPARLERDVESEVEHLASEWLALKQDEKISKDQAQTAEHARKDVEERLRQLVPAGASEVEGYVVKRIQVGESYSLPLKKARAAGLWTDAHDEQFGQLISTRRGHERFQIERVGDELAPEIDDESVPF